MAQRRTVAGDGTDLAVTEWGVAAGGDPTVLLVHGYPDTSALWEPVAALLAQRYHVVAYDVRGAGRSSSPTGTERYRLEHLVDDMVAVADATSPGRPVHLVGHDWGSIQGWDAVVTASDHFASFTSLCGPGLAQAAAWAAARLRRPTPAHLRQLVGQQLRSWYVVAFHLPGAATVWRAGLGRHWPTIQHRLEHVEHSPSYPADTVVADGARGVALYRANFRHHLTATQPHRIDVPIQVIVATRDRYVSPALSEGLEPWAPRLWRTEVVAGHWLPRTHPDLVARYVAELVDHVGGAAESPRLRRSRLPRGGAAASGRASDTSGSPRPGSGRKSPGLFRGQVVVVTGGGAGIGRATALAFAREGATIVTAELDAEAADETASLVAALGAECHSFTVDVADGQAMENLAKWVEDSLGGADVVVNNAGVGMAGPMLDTSSADWEFLLGVNLWGVIHGSRLFGRQMVERCQGGHIVNLASAAAFTPSRSYPAYAASKAAVLMLTQCLRGELAPAGVQVHAICPGLVDTTLSATTRHVGVSAEEQDHRRRAIARLAHRRSLPAERVASVVLTAVRRGSPVVVVGVEARLGRALSRLSPATGRQLARLELVPH